MHKKIFLVVSIFTMFLVGSSVVKADSNKVYWKLGGKNNNIYNYVYNYEKEKLLNDESFVSLRDSYCSEYNITEEGRFASVDECKETYIGWELEYKIDIKNVIIGTYELTGEEIDVSKNNDGSVMMVLSKNDDNIIDAVNIVYDGILEFNEDSSYLFSEISGLQLNNIDTSKVTNMSHLFESYGYGSDYPESIYFNEINTSSVTDMSYMFANSYISYISMEYYNSDTEEYQSNDTSKVTNMSHMFSGIWSLEEVDLSSLNTKNVTDMSYMFASNGLSNVDLSSFDTSKVTDMSFMFSNLGVHYATSYQILDLTSFDTKNVTDMEGMFYGNHSLTQIYVGNNFKTTKLTKKNTMFLLCPNLVGQAGTTYDVSEGDQDSYLDAFLEEQPLPLIARASSDYAKIDEKGNPGFFSVKASNNLDNYDVSAVANQNYTGSAITPSVTVKGNSKTLVKDIDYTVSYSNNVLPGTATIIIKGINNIVGEIISTFNINALSLKTAAVSSIGEQVYTGSAIKPSLTVKYGNKTLSSSDYTVSYTNNINPGKATVTITGKGIYKDTITKYFTIIPSKPTGLKAKSQTTTSITLTWNKNGGSVTGYAIYQYNTKTKKWDLKVKTSSNTYTFKNLAVGTTYSYRVKAYKIIDGSYRYSDYSASLGTSTKTKAPTLKNLTTKSKKVTIKWSKVTSATGYEVYMKSSKNGKYSKIKTTKSLSYTKTKLKKNKTYYFKVRTYRTILGVKVYSGYSKVKSIKVR